MSSHSAVCSWRCNCGANVGPMKESPIARKGEALPMLSLYYFVRSREFINSNWVYIRDWSFGNWGEESFEAPKEEKEKLEQAYIIIRRFSIGPYGRIEIENEPDWIGYRINNKIDFAVLMKQVKDLLGPEREDKSQ